MEAILFSVHSENEAYDVVIEESLLDGKFLLIKRVGEVDYICGKYKKEELQNFEMVMALIGE